MSLEGPARPWLIFEVLAERILGYYKTCIRPEAAIEFCVRNIALRRELFVVFISLRFSLRRLSVNFWGDDVVDRLQLATCGFTPETARKRLMNRCWIRVFFQRHRDGGRAACVRCRKVVGS